MTPGGVIEKLNEGLSGLDFGPSAAYVYNPLEYALAPHLAYWEKYGKGPKKAVFLGMNPGPWGMAQTGVPFGDVKAVTGWLGLRGEVGAPARFHPKKVVQGYSVKRGEVSGQRLWGWAAARFGTPENFFADFFVLNYCPLMFLDETGKNVTPDKLGGEAARRLTALCDEALVSSVTLLGTGAVIGVGAWAARRAAEALEGRSVKVSRITHPSPANPAANRGWARLVEEELKASGVLADGAGS